jgi:hypothetical protein
MDAIRPLDTMTVLPIKGYTFGELPRKEFINIYPLEKLLDEGYIKSPFFIVM